MPERSAHIAASQKSRRAMDVLWTQGDDDLLPWVVTTAFYSAMHTIEAMLAVDNAAPLKHGKDHKCRNDLLRNTKQYQHIWKSYKKLHDASVIARYLSFDDANGPAFTTYLSRTQVDTLVRRHWLIEVENSVRKRLTNIGFSDSSPASAAEDV